MTFTEVIKKNLTNYVNFNGRANREEFWMFFVFALLIPSILGFIWNWLASIASLLLIIPTAGITVRRLHDINKSGWLALLFLIPVVNIILLIVWMAMTDSDTGANQYGEVPAK